jgi:AcrR family transcriptional regulator
MDRPREIREAAARLFWERGYAATSVNDIAAAVNIRAPSLYNHIESKQQLLHDIMFGGIRAMREAFDNAISVSDDTAERIRLAAEAHVLHHAHRSLEAQVATYEIPHLDEPARSVLLAERRAYARDWRLLIERGVSEGICNVASAKLAAFMLIDLGIGVSRWFSAEGDLSSDQIAKIYGDVALRIVCGPSPVAVPPDSVRRPHA